MNKDMNQKHEPRNTQNNRNTRTENYIFVLFVVKLFAFHSSLIIRHSLLRNGGRVGAWLANQVETRRTCRTTRDVEACRAFSAVSLDRLGFTLISEEPTITADTEANKSNKPDTQQH